MWSFPSENPLRRCLKGSQKSGSVPIFRIVWNAGPIEHSDPFPDRTPGHR